MAGIGRRGRAVDDGHHAPFAALDAGHEHPGAHVDEDRERDEHDPETDERGLEVARDSGRLRAITAGMASPAANRLATICGLAPMTSAMAIVSPMARPRPSIIAPTMPPLECGSTTPRIISHRRRAEGQRAVLVVARAR